MRETLYRVINNKTGKEVNGGVTYKSLKGASTWARKLMKRDWLYYGEDVSDLKIVKATLSEWEEISW